MLASLMSCASPALPVHTIAFAGDTFAGREINFFLYDPADRARILAEVTPILSGADVAILNVEGVISQGGEWADKGESRPPLYRAHPLMMQLLVDAGVDVFTAGNNHAGDYGPDALREMLDHARRAGIDYAGAGHDLRDASTPAYRVVGDTIVAFVGADLTDTSAYAATAEEPGSLPIAPARAEEVLAPILAEARRHAHVVLLSPHWGPNMATEPTAETRKLAKTLIGLGFDGILGHSAHVLHGVEIIDGKPVLYDAGNFAAGHDGRGDQADALLYELAFTRAGITEVRAHPVDLPKGHVALGGPATLQRWVERSKALGTDVVDGVIRCDPGAIEGPDGTPAPPVRPVPEAVREAPRDWIVDALPSDVIPADVTWDGVRLLGYRLLADRLRIPKASQVIDLYLTAEKPPPKGTVVYLEGRGEKATDRNVHLPGDWMLPGDAWPPGAIVHDRTLFPLYGKPEGTVTFFVRVQKGSRSVGELLSLGTATYDKAAPRIFDLLKKPAVLP